MGHFPDSTLGEAAWEFLRQFRRNPVTGRIEVLGQTPREDPIPGFDPERWRHDFGSREQGYNTAWNGLPV